MITEDLTNFGVAGRVLLQIKLSKDSFIGERLAHAAIELAYLGGLWPNIKLLRDLIQKFCMLVYYLNDVVQVV